MPYQINISHYTAPDRGDRKGGWRRLKKKTIRATSDEDATRVAAEYITKEYGNGREDIRYTLLFYRVVPVK